MAEIDAINNSFIHHCDEFIGQNSFVTLFYDDLDKVMFMLFIATKAFKTIESPSSRYEPNAEKYFPLIYKMTISRDEMRVFFDIVSQPKTFHEMIIKCLTKGKKTKDTEMCSLLQNQTSIGVKFIYMLYFTIFTNSISFSKEKTKEIKHDNNFKLFTVSHSNEKEEEFYNLPGESMIMVHGTNICNMYSIMRNGIHSMSKSDKYRTNGNVNGDGIYLSTNYFDAKYYGHESQVKNKIFLDENIEYTTCILFFNVKNMNNVGGGHHVQQENEIILRCIFCYNYSSFEDKLIRHLNFFDIIKRFAEKIKYKPIKLKEIDTVDISSNLLKFPSKDLEPVNSSRVVNLTRFKKEIERFMAICSSGSDPTFLKANFADPNDNKTPLLVSLMPDIESELYKDLKKYNIPGILVAIYFPEASDPSYEYPYKPFAIRVISPKLVDGTGRVTKGGSICLDQLYQNSWSPSCTIEGILRGFANTVGHEGSREGPGRVDPNRLKEYYTYNEYLFSYDQVAGFHGWCSTNN